MCKSVSKACQYLYIYIYLCINSKDLGYDELKCQIEGTETLRIEPWTLNIAGFLGSQTDKKTFLKTLMTRPGLLVEGHLEIQNRSKTVMQTFPARNWYRRIFWKEFTHNTWMQIIGVLSSESLKSPAHSGKCFVGGTCSEPTLPCDPPSDLGSLPEYMAYISFLQSEKTSTRVLSPFPFSEPTPLCDPPSDLGPLADYLSYLHFFIKWKTYPAVF